MLTTRTYEKQVSFPSTRPDFSRINRLLAAAVVSTKFCALLLTDPARAIAQGFAGEQFFLSPDEYNLVLSLRGSSLQEFARQLCEYAPGQSTTAQPIVPATYNDSYQPMV